MTVRASGLLARFAVEGNRLTNSVVKPKLFEPNKALQLSVFRTDGLHCKEICDLGVQVAERHPTSQRLHGWGEFDEIAVNDAGLRVDHDEVPPRHANIVGWPVEVSERKQRQQLLARRSWPVRLASPIQVEKTRTESITQSGNVSINDQERVQEE